MNAPSSRLAPLLFAFLACGAAAASVPKYDTAEVVLHSSVPFNGVSGTPNPFTSVTLTLNVTAPDGRAFQVDGFFDGDGAVWAARKLLRLRRRLPSQRFHALIERFLDDQVLVPEQRPRARAAAPEAPDLRRALTRLLAVVESNRHGL